MLCRCLAQGDKGLGHRTEVLVLVIDDGKETAKVALYIYGNYLAAAQRTGYHLLGKHRNAQSLHDTVYQCRGAHGFPDGVDRKACTFCNPVEYLSCAAAWFPQEKSSGA